MLKNLQKVIFIQQLTMVFIMSDKKENIEKEMLEYISTMHPEGEAVWAMVFQFSMLDEDNKKGTSYRIALDTIKSQTSLLGTKSHVYAMHNRDIVLISRLVKKEALESMEEKIRLLLATDLVASNVKNSFIEYYDLAKHYNRFFLLCSQYYNQSLAEKEMKKKASFQSGRTASGFNMYVRKKALLQIEPVIEKRGEREDPVVLVVDDDRLIPTLVNDSIPRRMGYLSAGTAIDGYVKYAANAPDLVFLDIGLPDSDGLTALHEFLSLDSEAFIVMLTSDNEMETINQAIDRGAKGYLTKPFTQKQIMKYISQIQRKKVS